MSVFNFLVYICRGAFSLDSYTDYLWIVDKIFVEVIGVKCFFFFLVFFQIGQTSALVLLCEKRTFFSRNL